MSISGPAPEPGPSRTRLAHDDTLTVPAAPAGRETSPSGIEITTPADNTPTAGHRTPTPGPSRSPHGVCATEIQAKSGLAQSTTSANMSMLERAGLVSSTRVGKFIHYRRNEERIASFVAALAQQL